MVYELILVNENLYAWPLDRTVPRKPSPNDGGTGGQGAQYE